MAETVSMARAELVRKAEAEGDVAFPREEARMLSRALVGVEGAQHLAAARGALGRELAQLLVLEEMGSWRRQEVRPPAPAGVLAACSGRARLALASARHPARAAPRPPRPPGGEPAPTRCAAWVP
jgi:hypothetical protein